MSLTEARTTGGGTTGINDTGHVASTAAERLGWPLVDGHGRDTASEAETDAGHPADSTAREGQPSPDTATAAQTNADRRADTGARQRTSLIEAERAESYNSRWKELKGEFVDDPRGAVRGANELLGEVVDELEKLFSRQRTDLEQGLDSEQTTTEDLRQALIRHRSFFDRLLSF
ncbi:MAG TPA: hypothetical protein VFY56_12460 [Propionibacteriaceae bacterium]|nr:hypothetical protein [Propionibacteriaceae bacterium]